MKSQSIDIAMTAALRPRILYRTLSSIWGYLKWSGGFRLVVDIAPVGDLRHTQNDVLDVVRRHFPNGYEVRAAKDSPQADALKWTWEKARGPFFLQWEDDWTMVRDIDLSIPLHFMEQNHDTGMVVFDRVEKPIYSTRYKRNFQYLNNGFWRRHSEKSLGGPPALVKKEFADDVCQIVNGDVCLDILSRRPEAEGILSRWQIYVYAVDPIGIVQDIGKEWMQSQNLVRIKRTDKGVQWIPKA